MSSMIDCMLRQAAELVERNPRSSAAKRRAISSAYYAAFHQLLSICADTVLAGGAVDTPEFERVYRAVDHGTLRNAFAGSALKNNLQLRSIGFDFGQLQEARIKADYSPPRRNLFSLAEVHEHLARAESLIGDLAGLNDSDRRALVIHLLFPSRKK